MARLAGSAVVLRHILYAVAKQAERVPIAWSAAWWAAHRFSFLLPHDRSYFALRHFCLEKDGLFVDVGANSGISALSFRKLEPNYRIMSYEPNPRHTKALVRQRRRDSNFDFRAVGIANTSGELLFVTPSYQGVNLHTFTSANKSSLEAALIKAFGQSAQQKITFQTFRAPVVTLDSEKLVPAVLKIDVEGLEYQVLSGAQETIRRHRPFIMTEAVHTHWNAFNNFCREHNYCKLSYAPISDQFWEIGDSFEDQILESRNIFIVPEEKISLLPLKKRSA
jgi:FkbM family methyltransferase